MVLKQVSNFLWCRWTNREPLRHYDTYLVGYYGMQNSGDDALLLSSIMGAKHYLQSRNLIVSANSDIKFDNQGFDINPIKEAQTFKGQNRFRHYRAAIRSERVIFGGGSVFHTAQDIEVKRHLMALTDPKLCMALGVGIGPFNDEKAKIECQAFLKECGFVGVRDQKSYDIAMELAPKANIKLTFDLAPMLTLSSPETQHTSPSAGVLINVCPVPKDALGNTDESKRLALIEKMSQVIEDIWNESKVPVSLLSLNGHEVYGDNALCQALVAKFAGKIPVDFIPYNPNPIEMMDTIRQFKVFLSMRLHGCVFGYLTGTPVLAVNYHTKGHEWCDQVGMPLDHRFDANSFNPKQLVEILKEGLESGFTLPALALNDAVQQSLSNWRNQYV